MPSEKILAEKKQLVSDLSEKLKHAVSGVLVDYSGITVEDDTKLRTELRQAGVDYSVQKNSLLRLAAKEAGLEMEGMLKGNTAIAISLEDLVAPARILHKFAEGNEKFTIKGGFVEGKVSDEKEVAALAKLPSKEVLVAQALGGLKAPINGFVYVLNANLTGLVRALDAIAQKQSA